MPSYGVCVSVTFVSCVKTNKDIFQILSPSGSHTISFFPYQTGWRYSDSNHLMVASICVEVRFGTRKSRFGAYLPAVNAATGEVLYAWSPLDDGHHRASYDKYIAFAAVVYCWYSTTKCHARLSHRLRGSSERERPSALSHCT